MEVYGLRAARRFIAQERKSLAEDYPRSQDPFVQGARNTLKRLDEALKTRIRECSQADNLPKVLMDEPNE